MYAAESIAPEGRDAQAPDLRGGCVYGHGPSRCGAAAPMGRGETPGLRGGAKRQPDAALPPEPSIRPRSAALELSASCVRAGFPHPGRRGRV